MDKLVSVTTRLNKECLDYIQKCSKMFNLDKSTVFRILLQRGILEDRKEKALESYIRGEISLEGASKYADMYLGDFLELMRQKGIESNVSKDDFTESLKNIKQR